MIVLDYLLNSFFVYLKKYRERGLLASIFLLTVPLGLNISALLILIFYWTAPGLLSKIDPFLFGGIVIGLLFLTDKILKMVYLKGDRNLETPKFKIIYYLTSPIYYILSVVLFFLSFRYL